MNIDKAYLFGLIIGGGNFGNAEDSLRIKLPYKQWGSYQQNPERASDISRDILRVLGPMFKNAYNINISYEATVSGVWSILCEGDLTELMSELQSYGINCDGDLRNSISIRGIVAALIDDNFKRRFIAGLADTIGSTNPNHRRFTNDVQILSFELKGCNFSFVCELCRLLYSVNCLPDQILWNHPNFHCGNDPYYSQWNKGFKLRVQIDQYAEFGAVAFTAKAKSLKENLKLQKQTHDAIACPERDVKATQSCVHPAENDMRLPDYIRGGHYLHNRHVCAVLGCENAPYDAVRGLFSNVGNLITPFPILCKDEESKIRTIISKSPLLANRNYSSSTISVRYLYDKFHSDQTTLLYGNTVDSGYPITEILQGVAYILADNKDLKGKRPKGNYKDLIERYLLLDENLSVEFCIPELLTPLVFFGNNRGALVGARNPKVYTKLVSFVPDNEYKICVRQITEDDLLDEE